MKTSRKGFLNAIKKRKNINEKRIIDFIRSGTWFCGL